MIKTFKCKDTEALWNGQRVARFANIAGVALRKLQQLNAAATLGFLRSPPGNRLEPLQGDRQNQWSIRVNDQWRIGFRWEDGLAFEVEIVDYH